MDVYILDSIYRRVGIIDKYESIIWTDRYSAKGDFELQIAFSTSNRNLLKAGTYLSIVDSLRVMQIETIEDFTDEEGRRLLKVSGFSLETIFEKRLVAVSLEGEWFPFLRDGTPREIIDYMYMTICIDGNLDTGDILENVETGSDLFPDDTIPDPDEEIVYIQDHFKTLYDSIKEIADMFSMGFRIVRNPATNVLYFDVYMGCDRTTSQTTLPAVVFSPDLDNLKNTNRMSSSALYKNVVYVMTGLLHEKVYADGIDPSVEGFERRVGFIVADDITAPDISDKMIQRGKEELARSRLYDALDGELANDTGYTYGTHYNVGDLVELRDDDGTTSQMKVTEVVIISDKEGRRTYPTLSLITFITPGSWIGWSLVEEWDDLDTEEWEDV